ncbi:MULTISPECIES: class I SAM-dependent methyltransferase [Leptolyngbya]|uniref:class I SAM-dependent methyltransferase n=1 Tax=Leptolyngbya TaxID=47251 RepID=UPI0016843DF9|nr:class I SAM-dependent methyltransferase [Leptolyngbya sp. FACHB-1624]MBD1856051.1 class I SAM-dependent methyltransferase [Leptolyngbya sp. FACHB-1624]
MISTQHDSPYIGPKLGGFATQLSWYARQQMFKTLMQVAPISSKTRVLDVGVTSDQRLDCNFFEKLYPYPENITAVGTEDASFLEQEHPGLTFVRTDGSGLPFPDRSFDVVVTFAVIEHVGNAQQQKAFIRELCRVGKTCFITTPNRWFPIEFHTSLPLLHWLPPSWFRAILNLMGKSFWASEANLNLLTERDVLKLFPADSKVQTKHFKLWGMRSNLVFYSEN